MPKTWCANLYILHTLCAAVFANVYFVWLSVYIGQDKKRGTLENKTKKILDKQKKKKSCLGNKAVLVSYPELGNTAGTRKRMYAEEIISQTERSGVRSRQQVVDCIEHVTRHQGMRLTAKQGE